MTVLCLVALGFVSYLKWRAEADSGGTLGELGVGEVVPDFTLAERSGADLSLADLRGKVWVADFFFSYCGVSCPPMTREMARLQEEFKDPAFRLVSFTADPERDTPETLQAYAKTYGAGDRWSFLTGDVREIYRLAQDAFRLPIGKPETPPAPGAEEVFHSPRFILVDAASRIRGTYSSQDPEALRRLRRDIGILLESAP